MRVYLVMYFLWGDKYITCVVDKTEEDAIKSVVKSDDYTFVECNEVELNESKVIITAES